MKRTLTDKVRIYHVLDAIEEVDKYLATIAYEDFVANSEKSLQQLSRSRSSARHAIVCPPNSKTAILKLIGKRLMDLEIFPSTNTSALIIKSSGRLLKMTCPL
jgi:uncharacterized protein YbcI